MKRYEFQLVNFAGGQPFEHCIPAMNELGMQGWRVVSMQSVSAPNGFGSISTMFLSAFMEREVEDQTEIPSGIVDAILKDRGNDAQH